MLGHHTVQFDFRRAGVLICRSGHCEVGEIIINFHGESFFQRARILPARRRGDFHTLAARAHLAVCVGNLDMAEIQREIAHFLPTAHQVVTCPGHTGTRLIECQAFAILEQIGLDIAGRQNVKLRLRSRQDHGAAGADRDLYSGGLLGLRRRSLFGATSRAQENKANPQQPDNSVSFRCVTIHWPPPGFSASPLNWLKILSAF